MTTLSASHPLPAKPVTPATILMAGLVLGVAGDILTRRVAGTGPGFALWMALFGGLATWLAIREKVSNPGYIIGWSAVAFAAALVLVFRLTPIVILSMWAVMLAAAAMVIMELRGVSLAESTLAHHIGALFRVPLQALAGSVPLLSSVDVSAGTRNPRYLAIARGTIIALPLVVLFSVLFSQADAGFEALADKILSVFSPELPQHLVTVFMFSWLATGLLAALDHRMVLEKEIKGPAFSLGVEETLIVMGALTALFIVFVALQLPYLFGGRDTIEATAGLTLAQYARRGFFELVIVAGLSLGVLLVTARASVSPRVFRPLAAMLLVCVLLILASAAQRLILYTQSFGLTLARVTAFTAMVWITVCLLLFGLIILRGKSRGFAMGMTGAAMAVAFLFALSNPAAIIARVNTRADLLSEQQVDLQYLMTLGADAVPVLVANMASLSPQDRCMLARKWLASLDDPGSRGSVLRGVDDWRTWNLITSRAQMAIAGHAAELTGMIDESCPAPVALLPARP